MELKLNRERDHYIGAVLEYGAAESDSYESPQEVLTYNIDKYLGYMQEARATGTDNIIIITRRMPSPRSMTVSG